MSVGADEEWVKAAMTDDTMVVDLLVHLHAAAPPSLKPPPLEWSVRQRRSNNNPKQKQTQRASPTTPLSWSGATSLSGGSGGAGVEEYISNITRSKTNGEGEKPASKRSRKKKTLIELKDEEHTLLKERRELKRELGALRTNLEKQRASNEKLKRMKIEIQPIPDREMTSIPLTVPPIMSNNNVTPDSRFVLPDLNMPFEEDVVCGVS